MSLVLLGILNSQAAAAGGAGAYDLLETINITAEGSSFSFTGLDAYSDYKHLQMRMVLGKADGDGRLNSFYLRFNSDGGTNYPSHQLTGTGSAVSANAFTNETLVRLTEVKSRNSGNGIFGAVVLDILDFSNTNKYKTVRYLGGGNNTSESKVTLGSSAWLSTNAITRIDSFSSVVGTGSRISLYGIKGA